MFLSTILLPNSCEKVDTSIPVPDPKSCVCYINQLLEEEYVPLQKRTVSKGGDKNVTLRISILVSHLTINTCINFYFRSYRLLVIILNTKTYCMGPEFLQIEDKKSNKFLWRSFECC